MTNRLADDILVHRELELDESLPLEKPERIEISSDHQALQIKLKGRPAVLGALLLGILITDLLSFGFLYFYFDSSIRTLLLVSFGLVTLISVSVPAFLLSAHYNHHRITVRSLKLGFWQSPFNFIGGKVVNTFDILNFSLEKVTPKQENQKSRFVIYMHLKNGKVEKICFTKNIQEAMYIEKILEDHLGFSTEMNETH